MMIYSAAQKKEETSVESLPKDLVGVGGPTGYGSALIAWKGQQEFFRSGAPGTVGSPLTPDLAFTFIEQVYILLRTGRKVSIYRGYETAGLDAPFGEDHPSYMRNLVRQRKPGKPDGLWWTPTRPSMAIDDLKLSGMHRAGIAAIRQSNSNGIDWTTTWKANCRSAPWSTSEGQRLSKKVQRTAVRS